MTSERARVAVLISGRGSNMAALIYAAKAENCPFEIILAASNDPQAPGLTLAAAEGVETFSHPHKGMSREGHDQIMHEAITRVGADYVVLAGYMRILSDSFVRKWQDRMLNIHPSLLLKYKGLATYQPALAAADSLAGCPAHLLTPDLAAGPVPAQPKGPKFPADPPII